MATIKWAYRTMTIPYHKKHRDWVLERGELPPLVGLAAVLEAYGQEGWELVQLQPEHVLASPGFGTWHVEPKAYRAIFKRPDEY